MEPELDTHVYVILDQSYSMHEYVPPIRECLEEMSECNVDTKLRYHFIVFSDYVDDGPFISELRGEMCSTKIHKAFARLNALIAESPLPQQLIVVFISDGKDDNPDLCATQLKAIAPMKLIPSLLFTVGIGAFPTSLVIDCLRPIYHTGSDTLAPVIPLNSLADCKWVFGQIESLITNRGGERDVPKSVTVESSAREIGGFVRGAFNNCVVSCAKEGKGKAECYDLLFATGKEIAKALEMAKAKLAAERLAGVGKGVKPLSSVLLKQNVYNTKTCVSLAFGAISRLNKMMDDVKKGVILSELSDDAKKEMLGWANVQGKHILVAVKYRSAKFADTKRSLLRLLTNYQGTDADAALEDPINLVNQMEYFMDAKTVIPDLLPQFHSLIGILKFVPFVCRTLTYRTPIPTDILQVNAWLAEVESMPMVHRLMTTHDFFEIHGQRFEARGEIVNGLMLLGGNPDCNGIYCHIATYLLTQNPGIFDLWSRLATAASTLVFLLGNHGKMEGWMERELETIEGVVRGYAPGSLESWEKYVVEVCLEGFKVCLISESDEVPPYCKCPGLSKFVLAMWTAIKMGRRFTKEELLLRHQALLVEFVSRRAKALSSLFKCDFLLTADEFVSGLWGVDHQSLGARVLGGAVDLCEAESLLDVESVLKNLECDAVVGEISCTPLLVSIKLYQFTVSRIHTIFKHLAAMCGEDVNFEMTQAEYMRVIFTARNTPKAVERFKMEQDLAPMEMDEVRRTLGGDFLRLFKAEVRQKASAFVREKLGTYVRLNHSGLPRLLLPEYISRFKDEFGVDIGKDWGVGASGLSTVACCFPKCPHFLRLLSRSGGRVEMGRKLRSHLRDFEEVIPGFHKCIMAHCNLSTDAILSKMVDGEVLSTPWLSRGDQRWLRLAEEQERAPPEARKLVIPPHGFKTPAEYKASLEAKARLAMVERMRKSLRDVSGGSDAWITDNVDKVKESMVSPEWSYEEFRLDFMSMYRTYSELIPEGSALIGE